MEATAKNIDNLRFEVVKGLEENPGFVSKINVVSPEKREFLNRTAKENKKDVWNVIRKETENKQSMRNIPNRKKEDYKTFNSEKYMGYQKKFNEEHAENQAFLNFEKQEIMGKLNK